jgi:uncharacterized membrane protein
MTQDTPLEKLTSAVFGFALAVGALSLTAAHPTTNADIAGGLVLFSLSFIILVVIWWGTIDIMSKIDQHKPRTIFLNIVLLFFVAIEPYLLNILNINAELFPLTSTLYGIDMAVLMGLTGVLFSILLKESPTLPPKLRRRITISRNNQFMCMSLFLVSLLPLFLDWKIAGFNIRVLIWFATLMLSLIVATRNRTR